MCSIYTSVWQLFFANARNRWKDQAQLTTQIGELFKPVDVAVNLVLNLIMWNIAHLSIAYAAGFSWRFLRFSMIFIVLPSLLGGSVYIHHKYGQRMWTLSLTTLKAWLHNWMLVNSIALVCWTQQLSLHAILLMLEPWLPGKLQGTLTFPLHVMENYVINSCVAFHVASIVLLLTIPVWKFSHQLNMQLVGRRSEMTSYECFLEIVYTGSSSMSVAGLIIPVVVLQSKLGVPFHRVHVLVGALEILLVNQIAKYKFQMLHQLAHDIKPLYHMVHIEHHICKGIYPTTSAAGLWEFWMLSGSFGFFEAAIRSLPYVHMNMIYGGANILVHTMWPWKSWAQWHTLHHVVLADVYSVNIPSDHDRAFSKDFARYHDTLCRVSPFVRHEWLSDATSAIFMIFSGLLLHYGLGWSIFAVWHEMF